ncbi:MAG: four helix bundle protein [Bacteroidota bacterium]|nr:four helix bundle protein [Bacteroidota bacterium]
MATIQSFEDLKVWQKARILCSEIFSSTSIGNFSKDFGLKDQINRASGSIMDNIAEGFGRKGNLEFINFLTYSSGSVCECKSQLYKAFDRNYITEAKRKELLDLADEVGKMISSLMSYLGGTELRGAKFKAREKKINESIKQ